MKISDLRIFGIALILILTICLQAAPVNLYNQTDPDGIRTGRWVIPLDKDLQPSPDSLNSPFYKVINYLQGKPTGFVNYFYRSGRLYFQALMQSVEPDVLADGTVKYYSESGEILQVLNYIHNKLNGEAFYYYADGRPQRQGYYTDDRQTGIWKEWDKSGNYGIGTYSNDQRDGAWIFYNADGTLQAEGKFCKGLKTGKWTEYLPDGRIETGVYSRGVRQGAWSCHDAKGQPCYEGAFDNNQKNGLWKEWNPQGELAQGEYRNGKREGSWTFYRTGGSKAAQGSYSEGVESGIWQKFNELGIVTETIDHSPPTTPRQ
jgi:antitoxin component YwqK of YwqJK toxin-antitoxin module